MSCYSRASAYARSLERASAVARTHSWAAAADLRPPSSWSCCLRSALVVRKEVASSSIVLAVARASSWSLAAVEAIEAPEL